MTTRGLAHINFRAQRGMLDALKDFYCDIVGLQAGTRPPFGEFGYWLYAQGQPVVHLSEAGRHEPPAQAGATTFNHIAFACEDSGAVEALLRSRSIQYRKTAVPATAQVQFFLSDPAGNKVELNFTDPDQFTDRK